MSSLPPQTQTQTSLTSLPLSLTSSTSSNSSSTSSSPDLDHDLELEELDELPSLPLSSSTNKNAKLPPPKKVVERKEEARKRADSLKWSGVKFDNEGWIEIGGMGQKDLVRR